MTNRKITREKDSTNKFAEVKLIILTCTKSLHNSELKRILIDRGT